MTSSVPRARSAHLRKSPLSHPRALGLSVALASVLALVGCGSTTASGGNPGTPTVGSGTPVAGATPSADSVSGMPGMSADEHHADAGRGLLATEGGYTLKPMLPSTITTGAPLDVRFQIVGSDGAPAITYKIDQTKLLHLYLVREDLTGYQHLHPVLAGGTWTVPVTFSKPGPYRLYTDGLPMAADGTVTPVVLSTTLTVAGAYDPQAIPAPMAVSTVDGYTVRLDQQGAPAGQAAPLTFAVSKEGRPVSDLEPYLDSFAHLTAFQSGTLAYEHLHPEGGAAQPGQRGGPALAFTAAFGAPGAYVLYLQFQTAGSLHTATLTLPVR